MGKWLLTDQIRSLLPALSAHDLHGLVPEGDDVSAPLGHAQDGAGLASDGRDGQAETGQAQRPEERRAQPGRRRHGAR